MTEIKVFVSSTTRDLLEYRLAALDVIRSVAGIAPGYALVPTTMDTIPQDGERKTAEHRSRQWVGECDWMVLIVGFYAGWKADGSNYPVTESEYRHACALLESRSASSSGFGLRGPKKLFAFMAGAPKTADSPGDGEWAYRVNDGDQEDLKDYRSSDEGFATFRRDLKNGGAELFNSLAQFKQALLKTLSNHVLMAAAADSGPMLMEVGLLPFLDACSRDVGLLKTHKDVHDALHKIRQFGVKPIRNAILPKWLPNRHLAPEDERRWRKSLQNVEKWRGVMKKCNGDLAVGAQMYEGPLVDFDAYALPDPEGLREAVIEQVNMLASLVQGAFNLANEQMVGAARFLKNDFRTLQEQADQRKQLLAGADADRLREHLERTAGRHDRLQLALSTHHQWQQLHNGFERLENKTSVLDFLPWQAEAGTGDVASSATPAPEAVSRFLRERELVPLPGCRAGARLDRILGNAEETLKAEGGSIPGNWVVERNMLEAALQGFAAQPTVETYSETRNAFDQLFFMLDEATQAAVERAKGRVDAIDEGLEGVRSILRARKP